MLKVKHCPRITLSDPKPCDPPPPLQLITTSSMIKKSVTSTLPPPSFLSIPFSIVTKKSVPLLTPPLLPFPPQKVVPPGPYIRGQLGHVFFSLGNVCSYMELPHRHLLIIQYFWKPFTYEHVNTKFILTDPLGNKWSSPQVFNLWHETIESGEMSDIDQKLIHIAIVHIRNKFKLTSSICKNSYKNKLLQSKMRCSHQLTKRMSVIRRTQTSSWMKKKNNFYCSIINNF